MWAAPWWFQFWSPAIRSLLTSGEASGQRQGCCCCSAPQSCLTLWDHMDCSTAGFSIIHCLPEFSDSCPLSRWCYLNISSSATLFSFCLQFSPTLGSFPMFSLFFASGGQSIGASAPTSFLPVNLQDWLPLGLTGLVSLQSKGLTGVFSSITIWETRHFLQIWFT